jgi:hypothetical protein
MTTGLPTGASYYYPPVPYPALPPLRVLAPAHAAGANITVRLRFARLASLLDIVRVVAGLQGVLVGTACLWPMLSRRVISCALLIRRSQPTLRLSREGP